MLKIEYIVYQWIYINIRNLGCFLKEQHSNSLKEFGQHYLELTLE